GQVVTKHIFVPFSPPSNSGGAYRGKLDAYEVAHNQAGGTFRVIVLNVRGKTVVMYLDSAALPTDEFPAFLTKADQILKTLSFPRYRLRARAPCRRRARRAPSRSCPGTDQ